MNLIDKIKQIYPELTDNDFIHKIELCNLAIGDGPFIKNWNHPTLPEPTPEQLAEVTP
jgi:hypothetical protein